MEHLHNDDLLASPEARALARGRFASIFHVLDNSELRAQIETVDKEAGSAKWRSQGAGILAVVLAVVALGAGAAAPLWHDLNPVFRAGVNLLAAVLALAAMYLSLFGILRGKRKQTWLENRLFAERLRQLHFQSFIWHLEEIQQSLVDPAAFQMKTRERIMASSGQLRGTLDSILSAILDPSRLSEVWVTGVRVGQRPKVPTGYDPSSIFEAYGELRLRAQISYADHKLGEGNWAFDPRRMTLSMQQRQFKFLFGLPLAALFILHIGVVIGVFAGASFIENPWIHILTAWFAFVALGAKTLQEGLGINSEVARYREYRAQVSDILAHFNSTSRPEAKLVLMVEMERTAFREMRDFLRTHAESSFLL